MLLIGLTGPSGAGKSTVAELFRAAGLPILDADAIYKDLLIPPSPCLDELAKVFGKKILTPEGTLDRKHLASVVFSSPDDLQKLNRVSHKYVMEEVRRQVKKMQNLGTRAAIFDAPQLFEAGADRDCDVIVSVIADTDSRIRRIVSRDGITEEAARQRIAAQYPEEFFRSRSDYIIENNCPTEELMVPVNNILKKLGLISEGNGENHV